MQLIKGSLDFMEKTVNDQHLVTLISSLFLEHLCISCGYTVDYARTNDNTTNEYYNEQLLSIKSECYNEHRCQNEMFCVLLLWKFRLYFHQGKIVYVFHVRQIVYVFIRERLFIVFTKENLFMLSKFTCVVYRSHIN